MFQQRIPRKFKDEYTEKLSKEMTLRGPSGNYWTAALAQRGEDIQLQDGWRDFVKDHSLEEGNFLVFQHVKDSLFDVLIFDKTGCEREDSHFVEQDGDLCHENCCTMFKNTNQQTNNTSLLSEDEDEDEDEDEEEIQQELGIKACLIQDGFQFCSVFSLTCLFLLFMAKELIQRLGNGSTMNQTEDQSQKRIRRELSIWLPSTQQLGLLA